MDPAPERSRHTRLNVAAGGATLAVKSAGSIARALRPPPHPPSPAKRPQGSMRSGGTHNDMTHGVVDAGLGKTLVAAALIRTRFRGSCGGERIRPPGHGRQAVSPWDMKSCI